MSPELKKGQFIDIVLAREAEILARHEAGESWNSIERELRCGKTGGLLVKTLRLISAQRIKQGRTPIVDMNTSEWDDDDFTHYMTKVINPRMRKAFWRLLQEYFFMRGIPAYKQREAKERLLARLISKTKLADVETIDEFMTVFVELVKLTCHLEDLHRLLLLPRIKKGVQK